MFLCDGFVIHICKCRQLIWDRWKRCTIDIMLPLLTHFCFLDYLIEWSGRTPLMHSESFLYQRSIPCVFLFLHSRLQWGVRAVFQLGWESGSYVLYWNLTREIEFVKLKSKPHDPRLDKPTRAKKRVGFSFTFPISVACFLSVSFNSVISGLLFSSSKHKCFSRTSVSTKLDDALRNRIGRWNLKTLNEKLSTVWVKWAVVAMCFGECWGFW